MRKIEFRAWDKKKKRMMKGYEVMPRWCEIYPDDDYEIMQYTGLTDSSGRKIYEGDVVVCHASNYDYVGIVAYDEEFDSGSYYLHTKKSTNEISDLVMFRFAFDPKEVLGNIFEDPHLVDKLEFIDYLKGQLKVYRREEGKE